MGTLTVPVRVGDLSGAQFIDLDALVDTEATYSAIPRDILARLGVEARETRSFELADDRVIEYSVGYATIRLEQREVIVLVIFAPVSTSPLLGATTLETAGLAVDLISQRLIPVTALLKRAMDPV
jgi:clan AA aspartic protease